MAKKLVDMGREFLTASGAAPDLVNGLCRVREELAEAFRAESEAELFGELVDVVLTIAAVASHHGVDFDAMLAAKHRVNLGRSWEPHPTIPGAVQHVKVRKVRR